MTERDPHGTPPNRPGAKLDAGKARVGLVVGGFARALLAVSDVATYGASKYTPGGWVSVPDGIERYTDAMYRHLLAEAAGEALDGDSGLAHAAHAAWGALARLELMLREGKERPAAPAADADGWIKWEGGEAYPVASYARVDVKLSDGDCRVGFEANYWDWAQVVAYRLSKEVSHG